MNTSKPYADDGETMGWKPRFRFLDHLVACHQCGAMCFGIEVSTGLPLCPRCTASEDRCKAGARNTLTRANAHRNRSVISRTNETGQSRRSDRVVDLAGAMPDNDGSGHSVPFRSDQEEARA